MMLNRLHGGDPKVYGLEGNHLFVKFFTNSLDAAGQSMEDLRTS
jgi:hypothetical protein